MLQHGKIPKMHGNFLYCSMANLYVYITTNHFVIVWQFLNVPWEWSFEGKLSSYAVCSNEPPLVNIHSCQGPPVWNVNPLLCSKIFSFGLSLSMENRWSIIFYLQASPASPPFTAFGVVLSEPSPSLPQAPSNSIRVCTKIFLTFVHVSLGLASVYDIVVSHVIVGSGLASMVSQRSTARRGAIVRASNDTILPSKIDWCKECFLLPEN